MTTKIKTTLLTVLFFFGLLTGLQAQTQIPKDSATGTYAYKGIVKVDSATKEELYTKAKGWILKTLKSVDNMVELDDKEFNTITGSGTINLKTVTKGGTRYVNCKLNFKVNIEFKDGRYKYSFENFTFYAMKGAPYSESLENISFINLISNETNAKMESLITSLKDAVSAANNKAKDDW